MSAQRERMGQCREVGDWVDVTRYLFSTLPEKDGYVAEQCLLDWYLKPATKCVFKLTRNGDQRIATRVS